MPRNSLGATGGGVHLFRQDGRVTHRFVLWDIDETLVTTGVVGCRALEGGVASALHTRSPRSRLPRRWHIRCVEHCSQRRANTTLYVDHCHVQLQADDKLWRLAGHRTCARVTRGANRRLARRETAEVAANEQADNVN